MQPLPRTVPAAWLLLLSALGSAGAGGQYDGEWIGSATSTAGARCGPADVTLTVEGKAVTGQARFAAESPGISGTVLDDGTLGATIGFQYLTGKFVQDEFEGTFKNAGCAWKIRLKRKAG